MPRTGKVVASIPNGTRVDALGWDPARKLIYIPNGGEGNVTVVHQDSADKYTVVATVPTFAGAKTITVDPEPTTPTCSSRSAVRRRHQPPMRAGAGRVVVHRARSLRPGLSPSNTNLAGSTRFVRLWFPSGNAGNRPYS